jgi:mRNA deadenylase 3'-5' endonuclease subunit Ccr4
MRFRVATYNVLATAYVKPDYFPGVPEHFLQPQWRVPALARHVEGLDCDIVCLQEVEPDVFTALDRRLGPLGYAGRYEQKGRGKPDGCATFFRQGTFGLNQARRLEYRDRERGPADHSGHIALLLALERDGRSLGIANTHVRWQKPDTPRDENVGLRQVAELVEAYQGFDPSCRDWVVCGDFNFKPDSEVVAVMRDAGFAFAHADRPEVRSAVAHGRAKLIDFIFHTAGLRSRPLDPPAITDETKLPAPGEPSDHVALVAEFDWAEEADGGHGR